MTNKPRINCFESNGAARKRRRDEDTPDEVPQGEEVCAPEADGEGRNGVPMIQTIRGLDSPGQSAVETREGGSAFQDSLGELRNFNTRRLFEKINLTDAQFEDWLQGIGLLHSKRTCECGARMRLRNPLQGRS